MQGNDSRSSKNNLEIKLFNHTNTSKRSHSPLEIRKMETGTSEDKNV